MKIQQLKAIVRYADASLFEGGAGAFEEPAVLKELKEAIAAANREIATLEAELNPREAKLTECLRSIDAFAEAEIQAERDTETLALRAIVDAASSALDGNDDVVVQPNAARYPPTELKELYGRIDAIATRLDGLGDPNNPDDYVTQAYRLAAGLPKLPELDAGDEPLEWLLEVVPKSLSGADPVYWESFTGTKIEAERRLADIWNQGWDDDCKAVATATRQDTGPVVRHTINEDDDD